MIEVQRGIKQEFDQFWEGVSDIVISLTHSDYTSTDTFLSNFVFVKERYFKFNETLSPEDRTWLAENHLPDFIELCSAAQRSTKNECLYN